MTVKIYNTNYGKPIRECLQELLESRVDEVNIGDGIYISNVYSDGVRVWAILELRFLGFLSRYKCGSTELDKLVNVIKGNITKYYNEARNYTLDSFETALEYGRKPRS